MRSFHSDTMTNLSDILSDQQAARLRALASDICAADPRSMAAVDAVLQKIPPAEPETMGFYPRGDEDAYERAIRGTVFMLSGGPDGTLPMHIRDFEDKYIDEALPLLIGDNWIDPSGLSAASRETIDTLGMLRNDLEDLGGLHDGPDDNETNADAARLRTKIRTDVRTMLAELHATIANQPYALISPDLGAGDTWHVAKVSPTAVERWQDRCLHTMPDGEPIAIRALDWTQYMSFLSDAFDGAINLDDLPATMQRAPLRDL